ncbi:MAG TPA: tetratricopeptide repeat protein, partial [Tepidisphaeraceae bacterium]|nr:tetratricopeptide repeat protein [Tepidisphaeraceae bacterium]
MLNAFSPDAIVGRIGRIDGESVTAANALALLAAYAAPPGVPINIDYRWRWKEKAGEAWEDDWYIINIPARSPDGITRENAITVDPQTELYGRIRAYRRSSSERYWSQFEEDSRKTESWRWTFEPQLKLLRKAAVVFSIAILLGLLRGVFHLEILRTPVVIAVRGVLFFVILAIFSAIFAGVATLIDTGIERRRGRGADWRKLSEEARLLYENGKYTDAIMAGRKAVDAADKTLGPDDPNLAMILDNLAGAERAFGAHWDAVPRLRRSLAIREKSFGSEHPDVAASLINLAAELFVQCRYAQSEPLYKRALAIRERALGPEHPGVATVLDSLAENYSAQRQFAQAEPLYERALAIREKALGPEHPDVAIVLDHFSGLYYAQGSYTEAETLLKRGLAIKEKSLGANQPGLAQTLHHLVTVYEAAGRIKEAQQLERRAVDEQEHQRIEKRLAQELFGRHDLLPPWQK